GGVLAPVIEGGARAYARQCAGGESVRLPFDVGQAERDGKCPGHDRERRSLDEIDPGRSRSVLRLQRIGRLEGRQGVFQWLERILDLEDLTLLRAPRLHSAGAFDAKFP